MSRAALVSGVVKRRPSSVAIQEREAVSTPQTRRAAAKIFGAGEMVISCAGRTAAQAHFSAPGLVVT